MEGHVFNYFTSHPAKTSKQFNINPIELIEGTYHFTQFFETKFQESTEPFSMRNQKYLTKLRSRTKDDPFGNRKLLYILAPISTIGINIS